MQRQDYLLLGLLALVWGASFVFIKVAIRDIPPPLMVFGRNACATLALLIYVGIMRIRPRDLLPLWRPGLVVGLLNAAVPYTLIASGERYLDSSLAGILNATAPLWTALLAPFFREADAFHWRQGIGLALGFGGVVVLARPGGSVGANLLGVAAVLLATLSYATATHYSRRRFQEVQPQATAFLQCLMASLVLSPALLFARPDHVPSLGAVAAMVWLGVGATAMAMVMSFRLIQRVGASRTIVVTFLIPPSAVVWGYVLLHERPGPAALVALAMILGGVFFITRPAPPRGRVLEPDGGVLEV